MRIQFLSANDALVAMHSNTGGLGESEVMRRLQEFGLNQMQRHRRIPVWKLLLAELTHFFALILWLAVVLCFVADYTQPGENMGTLGWAVLAVILINGLFAFWQQQRTEKALSALEKLLPKIAKVLRGGQPQETMVAGLVPGDIIRLEEGDDVPADARVLLSRGLRVNTSTITGESHPNGRNSEASDQVELIHARNILLAGTSIVSGYAEALVFATGPRTEFAGIARLTLEQKKGQSPLQLEIARLSRIVAIMAGLLGIVFFGIGSWIGLSTWQAMLFGIGILVANVPEGLLPTVTLALAMGAERMAKRRALICHLPAVETLGSATVICTDKTGTLTKNKMEVTCLSWQGESWDGAAWQSQTRLSSEASDFMVALGETHSLTRDIALPEGWSGDPLELALLRFSHPFRQRVASSQRLNEWSFDADRRRQSVLLQIQGRQLLFVKGAPEILLGLSNRVQTATGPQVLDHARATAFLEQAARLADQGLRVIAFAQRRLDNTATLPVDEEIEQDLELMGLVGLQDPLRPEVPGALQKCKTAGIRVIMITGDHPLTAKALACQAGLFTRPDARVVTGLELEQWNEAALLLALDAPEILFVRVRADQKMKIVAALKIKKEVVAVTGDGVNDAPALKLADIGIAMGISGTDVARESADMVLLDDNFANIVDAIEEGRAVFANVRKFLTYILTSNVPEVIPYLCFVLLRIPLPLTIIQILAVDLGTDMLPALGLGMDKPEPGLMHRPPRQRHERLLDVPLMVRAYLWLGLWESAAAMAAFFFVLKRGGWHWGEQIGSLQPLYREATTATLVAIVLMQVVNVYLCRTNVQSNRLFRLGGNRMIPWAILLELVLLFGIVYTKPGQLLFQTAPISLSVWLFVLPFMAAFLLAEVLRLWLMRRPTPSIKSLGSAAKQNET